MTLRDFLRSIEAGRLVKVTCDTTGETFTLYAVDWKERLDNDIYSPGYIVNGYNMESLPGNRKKLLHVHICDSNII